MQVQEISSEVLAENIHSLLKPENKVGAYIKTTVSVGKKNPKILKISLPSLRSYPMPRTAGGWN